MLLFHGTSLNRLKEAIKDGFLGTDRIIWSASECNTTYFYTESFLRKEYDISRNDKDALLTMGIQYALESADFALSQERHNLKRVVLVFESNDLKRIGKLEQDNSCGENMNHCLKFSGKLPLRLLKKLYVDAESLDMLALYFIGLAEKRNDDGTYYINTEYENNVLPLLECAKILYENFSTYFLENMESIDCLTETTINQIKGE